MVLGKAWLPEAGPSVLWESEGKVCGDWSGATRPAGTPTAFSQYSEDNNRFFEDVLLRKGLPGGSDGIESAYYAGDPGSITGLGRSPGEGNGNLLWYFCLENPMDRGVWWAAVHRVAKGQT